MNHSFQTVAEQWRRGALTRRLPTRFSDWTPRRIAILILIAAVLVSSIGYGAVWGMSAYSVQKAARADLNLRFKSLETLVSTGKALTPAGLIEARTDLEAVDADLARLQGLLPFSSISAIEPEATIAHTLNLGRDVVGAALAGLRATQTLSPAVLALIGSVTHSSSQTGHHPLTLQDIAHAQQAFVVISQDWSAALAERRSISSGQLAKLGDPRLGKLLAAFDHYAPLVTNGLSALSATLDWSPSALGLLQPFHILLFNMDTDELRATGGFLGNFAVVTLSGGLVTSGIHLHDIYTLDCPNNVCPQRALPPDSGWWPLSRDTFGLRDSNLNPDFPSFAGFASTLYQQMTGTRVDMVVAITPAIIEDIMRVTGPLTVPQYNVTVTAENLAATIHYYHQNPQITAALGIDYKGLGTTVNKAFDVLVSQALMSHVATLSSSEQGKLGKLLVGAFATKDIQMFVSDSRLEQVLQQAEIAGQVLTPNYDNLMVVDANDGATYSNADMRETISDSVGLDGAGAAHHSLTITYNYLVAQHGYYQRSLYEDFVRVIAPTSATGFSVTGPCAPEAVKQSYHAVFGCQLSVQRGQQVSITVTWVVPHAFTPGAKATYRLMIQRQAGARVSMRVTLAPPHGRTLVSQSGALVAQGGNLVWTTNPLLTTTILTAQAR